MSVLEEDLNVSPFSDLSQDTLDAENPFLDLVSLKINVLYKFYFKSFSCVY